MRKNTAGKVLVIFLVIVAILLISLTAISMFFFQKEIEKRKIAESSLQDSIANGIRLDQELKEFKKKAFLLEEKNKEADERINGLLDELELEQGLREEMKLEVSSLNESLAKEKKAKEKLQAEIGQYQSSREKIQELESRVEAERRAKEQLETRNKELEAQLVSGVNVMDFAGDLEEIKPLEIVETKTEVKLDKIVVNPTDIPAGRILSVDRDTEFVITNLGSKDGVAVGKILSVYRGNEFLGDIQITRVQPEMSAADLIPPFSSQRVRKNDQVVAK